MDILEFQGEHRWLSNFWPAAVTLDGVVYPSVENAYQAAKTIPIRREPFRFCTAGAAKRLGRTVPIRPEWEEVKLEVMRALIAQKFALGSELGNRLRATDGRIVEGNTWGDVFWGVCRGRGENHLGRILIARREYLQAEGK